MYNSSHPSQMNPRISFSYDFVESHSNNNNPHHIYSSNRQELAPPSTDFEFSIANNNRLSVTSADELFFKGKLLPSYKDNNKMQRTIRDELLANDDESEVDLSVKPPKGSSSSSSSRWKGFLGLRKSHIGSKKPQKSDVSSFDSSKRFSFSVEDPNSSKSTQEMMSSEGPSNGDIEMRI